MWDILPAHHATAIRAFVDQQAGRLDAACPTGLHPEPTPGETRRRG